jgi:hypothetical protein
MDLCADVFNDRMNHPRLTASQKMYLIDTLAMTNKEMNGLRKSFFEAVDASWEAIMAEQTVSDELLNNVSASSRHLAITARELVDKLYPLCGLIAASTETEINHAWRDLHTASQHALLTFSS